MKYSRVGLVTACGLCLPFLLAMTALVNGQPQVERVIEVAPRCPGTRSQTWASLAWSPQSQCWLVAWREGYLNEEVSDIWCARISADGKALDPAGIRITSGPGLKDKPQVASDGTDFMVVWEDLRNGRDWDVYAARVTAQGKVLDANGFVVAAGQHNQCRPDVGFAAGFYLVVWQEFVGDGTPNTPGNAYVVRGNRISSNGKPADDQPIEIARIEKESHALNPVLACQESTALVGFTVRAFASGNDYFARRPIDVATGRVLGPTPEPSRNSAKPSYPSACFGGGSAASWCSGYQQSRCGYRAARQGTRGASLENGCGWERPPISGSPCCSEQAVSHRHKLPCLSSTRQRWQHIFAASRMASIAAGWSGAHASAWLATGA